MVVPVSMYMTESNISTEYLCIYQRYIIRVKWILVYHISMLNNCNINDKHFEVISVNKIVSTYAMYSVIVLFLMVNTVTHLAEHVISNSFVLGLSALSLVTSYYYFESHKLSFPCSPVYIMIHVTKNPANEVINPSLVISHMPPYSSSSILWKLFT